MSRMSTPKKYGKPPEDWRKRFLKAMAGYPVIANAAKASGVHVRTVNRELLKDASFRDKVDRARRAGIGVIEDAAFKMAKEGNATLIIFLLKCLKRKTYSENSMVARELKDELKRARDYADQLKAMMEEANAHHIRPVGKIESVTVNPDTTISHEATNR
jgi:hypothetical protein